MNKIMIMNNKKGQSSTIGVTIAIVLGIALIIFMIWGFSTNWSMFTSTSRAYTGTTNLDTVKRACQMQCDNEQEIEYCRVKKSYIDTEGERENEDTCEDIIGGCSSFTCDPVGVISTCKPNAQAATPVYNKAKAICKVTDQKFPEASCVRAWDSDAWSALKNSETEAVLKQEYNKITACVYN